MCAYMSFFKQNTLHLHLSDNLYNNPSYTYGRQMELYAAFRLLSDDPAVDGLNKRANESYTRAVFDEIQTKCAARGVTIRPEIEAPGHALVITQWKPELGLRTDYSLLNISNPETIPTMKLIWKTFLPWFHSKTVSIGADEYVDESLTEQYVFPLRSQFSYPYHRVFEPRGLAPARKSLQPRVSHVSRALVSGYKRFVDEMGNFIAEESGKKITIWGTFPPASGADVNTSAVIQHWANFEALPYSDFIQKGYNVLNSGDYVYVVGKWSEWYGLNLDLSFLFHGSPDGSPFAPNIFDRTNASRNAPRDSSALLGHIAPLWNDWGPNSTTVLEAYYSWRDGLPALADMQWGGKVTENDYPSLFAALQRLVPGQNLDRRIPTKTPVIVEYDFARGLQDSSGNGYHAQSNCANSTDGEGIVLSPSCKINTPLFQKGRNYTMSFSIKPASRAKGPLFSAGDNGLWFGNGTVDDVMLYSGGNTYRLNYTFPVGEWTNASLYTEGRHTFLHVGNSKPMEFLTILGWAGRGFVWQPIAMEAPLATVGGGGFEGIISKLKLIDDNF
jgi:hexosaminidase